MAERVAEQRFVMAPSEEAFPDGDPDACGGATLAQLFLVLDALTAAQYDIKDVPARIRLPQPVDFVDPLQP